MNETVMGIFFPIILSVLRVVAVAVAVAVADRWRRAIAADRARWH